MIKILIVDDHGILRQGLHALLTDEADLDVVGQASCGAEAIKLAEAFHPNVVLMDISMPDISGIEATSRLKEKLPDIKIIILTVHEDKFLLQEAIRCGASGYVLKRALKSELLTAIQTVMSGELYIQPAMVQALLVEPAQSSSTKPNPVEELTSREIEVLSLIARGYTNSQTAQLLNISLRTVEFHRANIIGKLQIHSRVELVRYATENGLIDFQPGNQVLER